MRKLLILLCLSMFALAGCGDDGGGDVDVASQKKDADGAASGDSGDADSKDPEFTGKGGKDFCEYLRELDENEEDLDLGSGEDSPENRRKAKEALEIFDELEDKAPAEIENDVKIVIEQIRPIFQAFAEGKDPATTASSQPTEAEAKQYEAAGERVEAYSENVCGIDDEEESGPSGDGSDTGDSGGDGSEDEQAPAEEDLPADE